MRKFVRGKILAGQIISLVAFIDLALSAFVLALSANQYGYPEIESVMIWMGFIRLAEIPIAIYGIIHSVAPYGKFQKGTAIASTIYSGVLVIFYIIALFLPRGVIEFDWNYAVMMLSLMTAVGLLISGMIQAKKESLHSPQNSQGIYSLNPTPNRFDADYCSFEGGPQPQFAQSPSSSFTPSEANRTVADLSALRTLYEQQLITKQEYDEKKKEILHRDFSK